MERRNAGTLEPETSEHRNAGTPGRNSQFLRYARGDMNQMKKYLNI